MTDKFPRRRYQQESDDPLRAQHGQRYLPRLFEHVQRGELDPAVLATHDLPLEDAVRGYEMFKKKQDGCVRAVFRP